MLYHAPEDRLITRIYNVGQITHPLPQGSPRMVRRFYPEARITVRPDPIYTEFARNTPREIRCDEAQDEWGWHVSYRLEDAVRRFHRHRE